MKNNVLDMIIQCACRFICVVFVSMFPLMLSADNYIELGNDNFTKKEELIVNDSLVLKHFAKEGDVLLLTKQKIQLDTITIRHQAVEGKDAIEAQRKEKRIEVIWPILGMILTIIITFAFDLLRNKNNVKNARLTHIYEDGLQEEKAIWEEMQKIKQEIVTNNKDQSQQLRDFSDKLNKRQLLIKPKLFDSVNNIYPYLIRINHDVNTRNIQEESKLFSEYLKSFKKK